MDAKEFRLLLGKLEIGMSDKDLAQLIKAMDKDDDGLVDVNELDDLVRCIQRTLADEKEAARRKKRGGGDGEFAAPKRDFS